MYSPRRFTGAQRIARFLAAHGRCTRCGTPLAPGWHADHVYAYALGGPTDVINGQTLCPPPEEELIRLSISAEVICTGPR